MSEPLHFETRAIHAGQEPDPATGAVITPIYQTSTFAQVGVGDNKGFEYGRTGNPTRTALEVALASLENGDFGLAFASGMAAIQTALLLLASGDHLVVCDDVYGGTYRLFQQVLVPLGLEFTYVDMTDLAAVETAIRPRTRWLWLETPTNPLLKVLDIRALAELARAHEIRVAVDNTFASPYLQRPLELGADLVVHSTTKYIGGHSDLVGGALVTSNVALYERLKFLQNAAGAVPGPMDAWLALRGVKTLAMRMEAHCRNALEVAQFLAGHPKVQRVIYPGLPSHPQHDLARRQMRPPATGAAPAFGGMISFLVAGGESAAHRVASSTRVWTLAESLGGVESLIELPAAMTHLSVSGSPLEVDPALIRLSVGIEHPQDLLADLDQALAQA